MPFASHASQIRLRPGNVCAFCGRGLHTLLATRFVLVVAFAVSCAATDKRASDQTHASLEPEVEITLGAEPWTVDFSPTQKIVAIGLQSGQVGIFNVETGERTGILAHNRQRLVQVLFSPDGKKLATATNGGLVLVWSTEDWRITARITHPGPIGGIAFSVDGREIATGLAAESWAEGKTIRVFDLEADTINTLQPIAPVAAVSLSREGGLLAAALVDLEPSLLIDAETWSRPRALGGVHWRTTDVAFHPSGKLLTISGVSSTTRENSYTFIRPNTDSQIELSAYGTLRTWDAETLNELSNVTTDGVPLAVSYNEEGSLLAGLFDEPPALRFWRLEKLSGDQIEGGATGTRDQNSPAWRGAPRFPSAMSFQPNSRRFAVAYPSERVVEIYRLPEGFPDGLGD